MSKKQYIKPKYLLPKSKRKSRLQISYSPEIRRNFFLSDNSELYSRTVERSVNAYKHLSIKSDSIKDSNFMQQKTMETTAKRSKRIRLKKITVKKKRPKKSMRISMDMLDLKFRSLAKIE